MYLHRFFCLLEKCTIIKILNFVSVTNVLSPSESLPKLSATFHFVEHSLNSPYS